MTPAGIEVRHARTCRSAAGGKCNCKPTYRAHVWSERDRKRVRKTFRSLAAARAWRADAAVALRKGELRPPRRLTMDQAAREWLKGARSGAIRNRSGDRYKPSAVRSYEIALRRRVLPALGGYKLADLRRSDLQDFADWLLDQGTDASTIRNTMVPVRAIYRRHLARGDVAVNPTTGLELPAVRGGRDRRVCSGLGGTARGGATVPGGSRVVVRGPAGRSPPVNRM